jgi:hypothetical protein
MNLGTWEYERGLRLSQNFSNIIIFFNTYTAAILNTFFVLFHLKMTSCSIGVQSEVELRTFAKNRPSKSDEDLNKANIVQLIFDGPL